MSTAPTWYDVLDVDPTASTDEIRRVWKAAVADLDPTDRRFQRLSEAAAVLLDPERRASYDSTLRSADREDSPESAAEEGDPQAADVEQPGASRVGANGPERSEDRLAPTRRPRRPRGAPALRLLIATAVLAIALVAAAAWSWSRPDPKAIESDASAAREVAERAVVPVLSYDYRTLPQGQKEAESYLTPRYRDKAFRPLFKTIAENAPGTQSVVTTKVVESAIVRAGEDRVEVLLLVDRPTTNAKQTTPITYEDHVTVTMARTDDGWRIDDMTT